ncbi:caspase domain-containing protein [Streptomyces sp. NPDC001165]|uniref:caspase family protein n=1 Tax=Streptomyces sp. NPDC001165 TaxID=3364546 RepID=UPI0036A6394D
MEQPAFFRFHYGQQYARRSDLTGADADFDRALAETRRAVEDGENSTECEDGWFPIARAQLARILLLRLPEARQHRSARDAALALVQLDHLPLGSPLLASLPLPVLRSYGRLLRERAGEETLAAAARDNASRTGGPGRLRGPGRPAGLGGLHPPRPVTRQPEVAPQTAWLCTQERAVPCETSSMGTVYALFAGIDDYPVPQRKLRGAVNDVEAAARLLAGLGGGAFEPLFLRNDEATTDAVVAAIREHLGAAGRGDTALFWFSGHGTDYEAVLPLHRRTEATGRYQALVCVDSPREGGRPLVDKELGSLLDAVAAQGAHVAAVLDCCFSGGATRRPAAADLTTRYAPPAAWWGEARGERRLTEGSGAPPGRHVLLAASRLNQLSHERDFDGVPYGVFTHALLEALRAAGPGATYRDLLAAAHCRVQTERADQHPVLFPPEPGGIADQPFLGGAVTRSLAPHLLRNGPHGWEIDCGRVHGLHGDGPGVTEFTVTAPGAASRVVRARTVHADRTEVEPRGWEPDRRRVYPVALSALALPPTCVRVETPDGSTTARRAAELVREAIASAGPDGGPTPLLRLVDGQGSAPGHLLRVVVSPERCTGGLGADVLRRDGSAAVPPLRLDRPEDARRVADCLHHLTRWHQLLTLDNPSSPLRDLVRVEILPWTYDGPWSSDGPSPILPDGSGEIVCRYRHSPSGRPQEPWLSIRLHNRSATRTLWCVLLNLTDSYAGHTDLYPGHFIGPGHSGFALNDRPVAMSVPARRARPGAEVRDWLKLIVTEGELNTVPFHLPAWDPDSPDDRGARRAGADGMLRLTPPGHGDRDMGEARSQGRPGQWTTRTIPVRTVIPADRPAHG